jgi:hypothetical protein
MKSPSHGPEIFREGNECINGSKLCNKVGRLVGYEVLTPVISKSSVFWDITQYIPLKIRRRFGRIYQLAT